MRPVEQRRRRPGPRPSFQPNKGRRKLVKSLAVLGLRHEDIAIALGIRSPKTLRKHFRKELAGGMAEANAAVTRVAYEMAASGKMPMMTRFWLNTAATVEGTESDFEDEDSWGLEDF